MLLVFVIKYELVVRKSKMFSKIVPECSNMKPYYLHLLYFPGTIESIEMQCQNLRF
jgi:hypothetical protein